MSVAFQAGFGASAGNVIIRRVGRWPPLGPWCQLSQVFRESRPPSVMFFSQRASTRRVIAVSLEQPGKRSLVHRGVGTLPGCSVVSPRRLAGQWLKTPFTQPLQVAVTDNLFGLSGGLFSDFYAGYHPRAQPHIMWIVLLSQLSNALPMDCVYLQSILSSIFPRGAPVLAFSASIRLSNSGSRVTHTCTRFFLSFGLPRFLFMVFKSYHIFRLVQENSLFIL